MTRREYIEIQKRLQNGETVDITDMAGYLRHQATEQVRQGLEAAAAYPRPINANDLSEILARWSGDGTRWALFTYIVDVYGVTSEAMARGLAEAYTTGRADRKTALTLFRNAEPRNMMSAEDYETLRALPEYITIYRGANLSEQARKRYGLSWTLSKAEAEFFAWRFDAKDTTRAVFSKRVRTADVLAYFNTRHEQEIIIDVSGNVDIEAREPSPLYWERMKRKDY